MLKEGGGVGGGDGDEWVGGRRRVGSAEKGTRDWSGEREGVGGGGGMGKGWQGWRSHKARKAWEKSEGLEG